jgi:hypothetical protein
MKYFHSTTFEFSPEARQWILDWYESRFETDFGHNIDFTLYNSHAQYTWQQSVVGKELNEYLGTYGADTGYYGINAFVCNLGNPPPHVDTKVDENLKLHKIKSRFNVMVLGKPQDPFTWWDVGYEDCIDSTFQAPDGNYYPTKVAPDELPDPILSLVNVYTPSAFVKTDSVHSVSFTPGPRLIITVALDKTIEELLDCAGIS